MLIGLRSDLLSRAIAVAAGDVVEQGPATLEGAPAFAREFAPRKLGTRERFGRAPKSLGKGGRVYKNQGRYFK